MTLLPSILNTNPIGHLINPYNSSEIAEISIVQGTDSFNFRLQMKSSSKSSIDFSRDRNTKDYFAKSLVEIYREYISCESGSTVTNINPQVDFVSDKLYIDMPYQSYSRSGSSGGERELIQKIVAGIQNQYLVVDRIIEQRRNLNYKADRFYNKVLDFQLNQDLKLKVFVELEDLAEYRRINIRVECPEGMPESMSSGRNLTSNKDYLIKQYGNIIDNLINKAR